MPVHVTIAADPAELGGLRSRVVALARAADAPETVVEAFELAVSELATNVIRHTAARRLTVAFDHTPQGWVLDVSDAEAFDELPSATLPDPEQLSGRGLFVVQSVMDTVELIDVDGYQHIRCLKRA